MKKTVYNIKRYLINTKYSPNVLIKRWTTIIFEHNLSEIFRSQSSYRILKYLTRVKLRHLTRQLTWQTFQSAHTTTLIL